MSADHHEETPPPRMSDEDLRKLALDALEGRVWTSLHNNGQGIDSFRVIFMLAGKPKYAEQCGMLYEYMDKAGPRSINGMPSFFSMHVLHVDDMEKFFAFYEQAKQTRENFLAGNV